MKSKELRDILIANPELEVKYLSCLGDFEDDYPYYERWLYKVEVSKWVYYNERIFTDEEDLALHLYDKEECTTDDLAFAKAKEIFKQCKETYIIVWLTT